MSSSESEQQREWKDLMAELLVAIAKRLTSIADYSSFRGVCTSWRSAATFQNFDAAFPRVPRLLYFVEQKEETSVAAVGAEKREEETPVIGTAEKVEEGKANVKRVTNFLNLESNTSKITNFPPPPERPFKYLSCSGWILVANESEVSLKHFMLPITIKLPGLNTFPVSPTAFITEMMSSGTPVGTAFIEEMMLSGTPVADEVLKTNPKTYYSFITKMVLSGSPMETEADLLVMVIWGFDDQLAFCRPGDESWTVMNWWDGYFYDIIFHNGKLYALDYSLMILECDVYGSNPKRIVQVFDFPGDIDLGGDDGLQIWDLNLGGGGIVHRYLVESSGKFLVVVRYMFDEEHERDTFRIFEIELKDGSCVEIHGIGNKCLFVGLNSSVCVELPSSWGEVKPNSIYFAKTKPRIWAPDTGVYTLSDGRFEDFTDKMDLCFPPPIWVVPTI